jgi:hypothetical protein
MPLGPPTRNCDDTWNTTPTNEPKLGEDCGFLSQEERAQITSWWLAVRSGKPNTPNWDIASNATIGGNPGFLLVEAKAHEDELRREEAGKRLKKNPSSGTLRNHEQIGERFNEASLALARETKLGWALSRDSHYQMSNRFAWAWKLTEMGYPVVLVYLGFLGAEEMGLGALANDGEWTRLVMEHSSPLFPAEIWNRPWDIQGQTYFPLIRSTNCPLDHPILEVEA